MRLAVRAVVDSNLLVRGLFRRRANEGASSDLWRLGGADATFHSVTLTLKAKVKGGHLIVEESIDLPDGAEVDLAVVDPGDDLDDAERERLHAALRKAQAEFEAGKGIPAADALTRVRELRGR